METNTNDVTHKEVEGSDENRQKEGFAVTDAHATEMNEKHEFDVNMHLAEQNKEKEMEENKNVKTKDWADKEPVDRQHHDFHEDARDMHDEDMEDEDGEEEVQEHNAGIRGENVNAHHDPVEEEFDDEGMAFVIEQQFNSGLTAPVKTVVGICLSRDLANKMVEHHTNNVRSGVGGHRHSYTMTAVPLIEHEDDIAE